MCFLIRPLGGRPTPLQSHLLIVLDDDPLRPETTWQPPDEPRASYGPVGPGHPSRVVASAPRRPEDEPGNLGHLLGGRAWSRYPTTSTTGSTTSAQ